MTAVLFEDGLELKNHLLNIHYLKNIFGNSDEFCEQFATKRDFENN